MPRHASLRSSMKILGAAALVATTALAQSDGPSLEKLEKYRRDALLAGGFAPLVLVTALVPEVAHAGECHGDAGFVGGFDHVFVAD